MLVPFYSGLYQKAQPGNQGFTCYQVALAGREINHLLRVNLPRALTVNKPTFSLVLCPLTLKVLLNLTMNAKGFMFPDTSEASRVADTHCFLSCSSLGIGTLDFPPFSVKISPCISLIRLVGVTLHFTVLHELLASTQTVDLPTCCILLRALGCHGWPKPSQL